VREITNLSWPDTPLGAEWRPFGRPARMLTAVTVEWVDDGETALPVCATVVYLRVHRTRTLEVGDQRLRLGFRTSLAETDEEIPALGGLIDSHLIRARRHAHVLAGHSFLDDLTLLKLNERPGQCLVGVTAVGQAWAEREIHERDTAYLFDTCCDLPLPATAADGDLTAVCAAMAIEPPHDPVGLLRPGAVAELHDALTGPDAAQAGELLAAASLGRGLTVALLAAAGREHLTWRSPLRVDRLRADEAWDCLTHLDIPVPGPAERYGQREQDHTHAAATQAATPT
jgi:hypothetical protein